MPRAPGRVGVQHRAVDAQPDVAVACVGTTQPKQAPKPHAIPDSSASCAGTSCSAQMRPDRLEHRRRPAGVDLDVRVAPELGEQQVGDRARGGRPSRRRWRRRASRSSAAPSACAASRKPSRQRRRRRARPARSPAARSRRRRRPAAARRPSARRARSRCPNGPSEPQPVAGAQLAEPARARADVLEHELQPCRPRAPQHRERARQERALVVAPAPALGRGEHVELARVRAAGRPGRARRATS